MLTDNEVPWKILCKKNKIINQSYTKFQLFSPINVTKRLLAVAQQ